METDRRWHETLDLVLGIAWVVPGFTLEDVASSEGSVFVTTSDVKPQGAPVVNILQDAMTALTHLLAQERQAGYGPVMYSRNHHGLNFIHQRQSDI